jgi:hypothetical protein
MQYSAIQCNVHLSESTSRWVTGGMRRTAQTATVAAAPRNINTIQELTASTSAAYRKRCYLLSKVIKYEQMKQNSNLLTVRRITLTPIYSF